MLTNIICTFISTDRIGLIDDVASCISICGGNWLESNMSKLSGQFAGIVSISVPIDKKENLIKELNKLNKNDILIHLSEDIPIKDNMPEHIMADNNINISVIGNDRPGIIQSISHALNIYEVNIHNMQTTLVSAPMSAEKLFNAELMIERKTPSDIEKLKEIFAKISEDLSINIDLNVIEK